MYMPRTFNFFEETESTKGYKYPSKNQEEKASRHKVTRILVFRYTFKLPDYILKAAKQKGYGVIQLGYTTYKSSTWGFYKKST